jgi:TRAP-type mannitol/chloroaromatic compound transport system substrate-binding protein
MKKSKLESFGVQEMHAKEMQKVDGGNIWAFIAEGLIEAALDWDGAVADFKAGYNAGNKIYGKR